MLKKQLFTLKKKIVETFYSLVIQTNGFLKKIFMVKKLFYNKLKLKPSPKSHA